MIAKIRVLGLRGADAAGVRAAGIRIVEYLEGTGASGGSKTDPHSPLAKLAAYYEAGPDGRSRGRARGAGSEALGLHGAVSGDQLLRALTGHHPTTGIRLIAPKGSSGRVGETPRGARPVSRRGPADELLALTEAAFLAGVQPQYLRRLAQQQPRTRFNEPTASDTVDPRVGRRLVEALTGSASTVPWPGSDRDYLLAQKDGTTGEWKVARGEVERYIAARVMPEVVMGFDLVCAAPKSVSLLWAVGDEQMRAHIAAAFDEAVDATISYLEAHACYGMVDGHNQHGEGFAVVSYVHDVSRANDAHLHVHNLIPNMVRVVVRDAEGRPVTDAHGQPRVEWRAVDSGALLRHVKTAGFLGGAQLRHALAKRLGVEWTVVRNGVAEIASFPSELLQWMSSRHGQVMEEFAQLVEDGYERDGATEDAAQRRSRPPKTVFADEEMRAVQVAKLAEAGWTPEQVLDLVDAVPRLVEPAGERELAELADMLTGPTGLTAHHNTFTSRDVHQAVAHWGCDRLSADDVRSLATAVLADPRIVLCGLSEAARTRQEADPVFTTESVLASEDNLHVLYRQGRVDHGAAPIGRVSGAAVDDAIAEAGRLLRDDRSDPRARLSDEQRDLVRDVLASGDLVRCVLGPAGTGKTEAMRPAVAAWQTEGFRVLGCANGGAQAEELGRRLGIESQVVRAWLTRLDAAEDPRSVWPERTVVVVDEATQVSTRDAERLVRWATRMGTVLVCVGDPAQLGSVGAGGWFRHIVYAHGAPRLSTVYRQAGADMAEVRAALAGLRSEVPERVRKAMGRLAADGRIRVFDDPNAMLEQVVDDWYCDRQERLAAGPAARSPKPSSMMAAHHREVEALNGRARHRLVSDGTITGSELFVGRRRFAVGDEVVTLTQAGHTLVPSGASRDQYVRTGTVGVVTAVHIDAEHVDRQHLTVEFPGRGTVQVDWAYLTHEFDDGRTGGLAHAYAVTADRSQGSNMHAARAVGTDTTSRAALYVMVTRGETDIALYLVRDRDLETNLDDEQWLPVLHYPGGPFEAVVEKLERSRSERLANDLDPLAWDAQCLRRGRSLDELAAIRRAAELDPEGVGSADGVTFAVARRAEMAEESAVGASAVTRPDPALVARLGRRPAGGDHRRSWDEAVRAVTAYRARWRAGAGPAGYGGQARWAVGTRPAEERSPWSDQHAQAEVLVAQWAGGLDPGRHRRFWEVIEHIPRERATAGVHALLAAGLEPADVARALDARERDSVRTGAAILDYRVKQLLSVHHIDPAPYLLPPPLTQSEEWDRVARLLVTAEANHLSHLPVDELATERRDISRVAGGDTGAIDTDGLQHSIDAAQAERDGVAARSASARDQYATEAAARRPNRARLEHLRREVEMWQQRQSDHDHNLVVLVERLRAATEPDVRPALRERHDVLTLALDLLVDRALTDAAHRPPAYLTDLLGERPEEPNGALVWDVQARHIETWRHHTLGLSFGSPAARPGDPPSERALGPVPADPTLAASRARLLEQCQATLDIGTGR